MNSGNLLSLIIFFPPYFSCMHNQARGPGGHTRRKRESKSLYGYGGAKTKKKQDFFAIHKSDFKLWQVGGLEETGCRQDADKMRK